MANVAINRNGCFGLRCSGNNLLYFKLMQEYLVYIALGLAIAFLIKKYFFKSKKKGNCDPDCGSCH
jgi:hypothetical protein